MDLDIRAVSGRAESGFPFATERQSLGGRFGAGGGMAKPYSEDLRERVVDDIAGGATRREAAEHFGVSVSSAVRWHQLWRSVGNCRAMRYGGSRSPLDAYEDEILALVAEQPDCTLEEIVALMRKRRIPGSRTALFRFLERHGISSKKKFCTPANRNART